MLVAGLRADDEVVHADAARLLGELGQARAVPPLGRYVAECRYYTKTAGLDALGRIGDRAAVPVLKQILADPNVDDDWFWYCRRAVRASAAVALLALGDPSGADDLGELAEKDDDVFFCWYGPSILRLPDEPEAARRLKARITVDALTGPGSRRTRKSDPAVMTMMAEALGLLGGSEACAALRGLLTFHSRYVRGQAALGLLQAGGAADGRRTVEQLLETDGTDFVRIKAGLALVLAGQAGRAGVIAEAAGSLKDAFDRAVAVEALGLAGDPAQAGVIAAQLDHADPYVRQCALEALERLGAGAAQAAAERRLEDDNVRVRLQGAKLLAALDGEADA
jgi:HEAT repeat protein